MGGLWLPRAHAAERLGIDRRAFLAAGVTTGATALAASLLGGCNSRGPESANGLLSAAGRWNERVERALFRHDAMNVAPADAQVAGAHFPSYFVSDEVPAWDEAEQGPWRLEIGGLVQRPVKLTLAELKVLSRQRRSPAACRSRATPCARAKKPKPTSVTHQSPSASHVRAVSSNPRHSTTRPSRSRKRCTPSRITSTLPVARTFHSCCNVA
jgi:hypothetical protein